MIALNEPTETANHADGFSLPLCTFLIDNTLAEPIKWHVKAE